MSKERERKRKRERDELSGLFTSSQILRPYQNETHYKKRLIHVQPKISVLYWVHYK
jgi:hypothetical protein